MDMSSLLHLWQTLQLMQMTIWRMQIAHAGRRPLANWQWVLSQSIYSLSLSGLGIYLKKNGTPVHQQWPWPAESSPSLEGLSRVCPLAVSLQAAWNDLDPARTLQLQTPRSSLHHIPWHHWMSLLTSPADSPTLTYLHQKWEMSFVHSEQNKWHMLYPSSQGFTRVKICSKSYANKEDHHWCMTPTFTACREWGLSVSIERLI